MHDYKEKLADNFIDENIMNLKQDNIIKMIAIRLQRWKYAAPTKIQVKFDVNFTSIAH